ncbi:MAG TPA: DNA-directed RNA polymerase subunit omega [Woeseiaceae bacterium]|jgi:DNA-directed RNA polymerase subunit omega|nr:DNA-directed RNA polymerase subunit omega [Woeseiaceae bacterium]|tara:strand:+ start:334 stop:615 length:282 start_codon:yes stop_codon:yes gene_type:complete
MARITVEDCMTKIDNIFDMILLASKRAKRIANGAEPLVERENDKPTVIALREIADGKMNNAVLEEIDQIATNALLQEEESDEIMPLQSLSVGR